MLSLSLSEKGDKGLASGKIYCIRQTSNSNTAGCPSDYVIACCSCQGSYTIDASNKCKCAGAFIASALYCKL